MRRRRFLTASAAATALLAGCGSTADDPTEDPGDGTTSTHPTPNDSPTEGTQTPPPATDTPTDTPEQPGTPQQPVTDPPIAGVMNGSFEDDLADWTVGRQLPDDPNSGGKVESDIGTSTRRAAAGQQSLEIFIDGSQDDGTVWVQQAADLRSVSTLKVDGYSEMNSFNEILQVATYTGPRPDGGLRERDFDRSNQLQDHEGWKTYEYSVDSDAEDGLVAVGLNIVWETGASGLLDNVRFE